MFDRLKRKAKRAVRDIAQKETTKAVKKEVKKTLGSKKITGNMIKDFDKFKASWEENASSPTQSVFHFLIGAYQYSIGNKDLGTAMTTLILSKRHNIADSSSASGLKLGKTNKYLLDHMAEEPNVAKSYLGAHYKENYTFSESKLTMTVVSEKISGKQAKVIIQSGGKDNVTPVTLMRNKHGQWKLTEFSSIATMCRKPVDEEGDF